MNSLVSLVKCGRIKLGFVGGPLEVGGRSCPVSPPPLPHHPPRGKILTGSLSVS